MLISNCQIGMLNPQCLTSLPFSFCPAEGHDAEAPRAKAESSRTSAQEETQQSAERGELWPTQRQAPPQQPPAPSVWPGEQPSPGPYTQQEEKTEETQTGKSVIHSLLFFYAFLWRWYIICSQSVWSNSQFWDSLRICWYLLPYGTSCLCFPYMFEILQVIKILFGCNSLITSRETKLLILECLSVTHNSCELFSLILPLHLIAVYLNESLCCWSIFFTFLTYETWLHCMLRQHKCLFLTICMSDGSQWGETQQKLAWIE